MTSTALDLSQIRTDALSSAATFRTLIGLGSGDTPTFKATTLSTGTITASTPALDVSQTWNNSGVTFTGSKINITDTASAAESIIADYQLGGVSQLAITKAGTSLGYATGPKIKTPNYQLYFQTGAGGVFLRNAADNAYLPFYAHALGLTNFVFGSGIITDALEIANLSWRGAEAAINLKGSVGITWNNGATFTSPDLTLVRDGTGILAQRRTTNSQAFRLYNTTDSGITNYERGVLDWQTTSNVFRIGTEAGGTGTVRNIALVGGNVGIGTTSPANPLDIKSSGHTRISIAPTVGSKISGIIISDPSGTGVSWYIDNRGSYDAPNGRLAFNNGSAEVLSILSGSSGNIGISQSSPAAKLDILDTTSAGSGSLAASTLNIATTWNTTGTPTAVKLNITDTASNASSLLMDLQVGGVSRFNVSKNGKVSATQDQEHRFSQSVVYGDNDWGARWKWSGGGSGVGMASTSFLPAVSSALSLGEWGYTGWKYLYLATGANSANNGVMLQPSGTAHQLEQRNGANAQTFRLYNTYTDASNYERLALSFSTYSSALYAKVQAESAGTGAANIGLVLGPKGTGAITARMPDGTTAGGNARGQYAVDLQMNFNSASQVASGTYSVAAGYFNTASQTGSIAIGYSNTSSGLHSVAIGYTNTSLSDGSIALGYSNTASGAYGSCSFGRGCISSGQSGAIAVGRESKATTNSSLAFAAGKFATEGDAQKVEFAVRNKTTDTTATTLFIDGSSTRLTIPSGKVFAFVAKISGIKSDGSAVAFYTRKGAIKNVGGTTSLVGSIETIGTDIEDNASTDVAISADDTNDALKIEVTGIASETWRWVAVVEGVEIGYGT